MERKSPMRTRMTQQLPYSVMMTPAVVTCFTTLNVIEWDLEVECHMH